MVAPPILVIAQDANALQTATAGPMVPAGIQEMNAEPEQTVTKLRQLSEIEWAEAPVMSVIQIPDGVGQETGVRIT